MVAVVVGTIAIAAGLSWGALLIVFFVLSSALSHLGADVKARRTEAIVAKGGERDAFQVLANGGVFALAALLHLASGWPGWLALGGGSLAAATSDTWGTEVGTLARATPRSIVTWRAVAPGTSGGITLPGTLGAIAGAACVALAAVAVRWPWHIGAAMFAGALFGSTVDSLLGATVQARRWCDRCNTGTERMVHGCGARTRASGGLAWLDNDVVNVACGVAGGVLALLLVR